MAYNNPVKSEKSRLARHLIDQIEPLVIQGDRRSISSSWQREWIYRAASWADLLAGHLNKPQLSKTDIPTGIVSSLQDLSDSRLDPTSKR